MFELIFGSPITIIAWIIGSTMMAYQAFKYNKATNELSDAIQERESTMNHAPTWLRSIEAVFEYDDMRGVYSFMNIGLPYVRGCFERFAPKYYVNESRDMAYRMRRELVTGDIVYGHVGTKEDWLKVYQYLMMAQDVSPYGAIPINEPIGDFKEFCPNRLYTKFHECVGFKYVQCERGKLIFENSHWPKPVSDVVSFRLLSTITPLQFDIEIESHGPAEIWSGIEIKKVRRVYELPTNKNAGYHFPRSRVFTKPLKEYELGHLIRSYKGDHLVRLSDVNMLQCDITGLRVVIPRPGVDGKSFDTCGGNIGSSKQWSDGTYMVILKKQFRQYFENAEKIWVDPKYLYVWIERGSFKIIDPKEGTHHKIVIGNTLGGDDAEIRYAFGEVYMTRDPKPLETKYPNVNAFKSKIKSKFSLHVIHLDDTIYVCNNQKLYNPIGVNIWWTRDEVSSSIVGPAMISAARGDGMYTIDEHNVPQELTFFALDTGYYHKFGMLLNKKNNGLYILGKLRNLSYWLIMNVEANPDSYVFYVLSDNQFNLAHSERQSIFVNNNTGAIRLFVNSMREDGFDSVPITANPNLKQVHDKDVDAVGHVEQVRQDTSSFLKLVDSIEEMTRTAHDDILIPPMTYPGSAADWKKNFVPESCYDGPKPIKELEMEFDYTYVSIPSDFRAGRNPGAMWGEYHSYLFYLGTGNTMAYDIYSDRIVFKGTTAGSVAIEIEYCNDYSVHNDELKLMDIVELYIPDSLILPIRQAFLYYAARGLFSGVPVCNARYRINESLAFQAAESTVHRSGEMYGRCRCDLLYPGVIVNEKYVSTLNLVHSNDPNGDTVLVSHLRPLTRTEEIDIRKIVPIKNSMGELISYTAEERAAASISHYDLTMKREITFTSIAMPKYN